MTPEGWILNLGAIIGSIFAGYQASGSKSQARRARELSEPTGNGFAKAVLDKLESVEDKMDGHIHDHAIDAFNRTKKKINDDNTKR